MIQEQLQVLTDPVADALDDMAALGQHWTRNRERGRMPSGIRVALLLVAREALAHVDMQERELQRKFAETCGPEAYARNLVVHPHPMTPEMWPKGWPFFEAGWNAAILAERDRWKRIAENAQAVTTGSWDWGDVFGVPSHLMAALALALDEGPNAAQPATIPTN